MDVVTPTDRPKSVWNLFVIEAFRGVFLCCHFDFLKFSVGVRVLVVGLSQTSFSFFKIHGDCHCLLQFYGRYPLILSI